MEMRWTTKSQCSRVEERGTKHDPEQRCESRGKRRGSQCSSARRNCFGEGTSRPVQENQPTCYPVMKGECPQETLVIVRMHLSALFIRWKAANLGKLLIQAQRKGCRRTKETEDFCGSRQNIGYHPGRGEHHFAKIQSEVRHSAWCINKADEIHPEREKKGHTSLLYNTAKKTIKSRRSVVEQLVSCVALIEANMRVAHQRAWELQKHILQYGETIPIQIRRFGNYFWIWTDNDNDNDTLIEVPHWSDEGLALQARASGPWPHEKESVLQVKLALLARCKSKLLWTE